MQEGHHLNPTEPTPIVGVVCNRRQEESSTTAMYSTGERYLHAVSEISGTMPMLIPGMNKTGNIDSVLSALDGLVLTGGISNIEPHHYGQAPAPGEDVRDPGRDFLSLSLIPRAVERGIPVLGICRGMQEINVAYGGTLHQRLHEVPGRFDHRRPRDKPWAEQLGPRQKVTLRSGGLLHALSDAEEVMVNSLHGQGIDQIADTLQVEAVADDETIEALTVKGATSFAIGVQWHAEYEAMNHSLYFALFRAFGDAVQSYMRQKESTQ